MRISNEAAQFFPLAVEIPVVTADGTTYWYWHMATFFYESMWCLIVFILLMACRRGMRRRGDVFAWYVLLYGAGRTVVEGLRTDSLTLVISGGEVRVSQVLSAVMTLAVAGLFFARIVRSRRRIRLADWIGWAQIALALTCTFLGEFERNAYQMLFIPAQVVLGVMLVLDVVFLAHFVRRTGRLGAPAPGRGGRRLLPADAAAGPGQIRRGEFCVCDAAAVRGHAACDIERRVVLSARRKAGKAPQTAGTDGARGGDAGGGILILWNEI